MKNVTDELFGHTGIWGLKNILSTFKTFHALKEIQSEAVLKFHTHKTGLPFKAHSVLLKCQFSSLRFRSRPEAARSLDEPSLRRFRLSSILSLQSSLNQRRMNPNARLL